MKTRPQSLQIDPTELTREQSFFLGWFLFENIKFHLYEFKANVQYDFPNISSKYRNVEKLQNAPIKITLTHQLIYRQCTSHYYYYHFDVYSQSIASGGEAEILEIIGKLFPRFNKSVFYEKPQKLLVGKIRKNEEYEHVRQEYVMSLFNPDLHIRPPTFFTRSLRGGSSLVMDYIKDGTLDDFIESDYADLANNKNQYSTDVRIAIMLNLARKVEMLHDAEVYHLDLKPQNTMIEFVGNDPVVRLIDHGFSRYTSSIGSAYKRGTALYGPPELFSGEGTISDKIDIFCLFSMFNLLLRGRQNPAEDEDDAEYEANHIELKLFQGITDIDLKHMEDFNLLLTSMSSRKPSDRCIIHYVVTAIERIQFERKRDKFDKKLHLDMEIAYQYGITARKNLAKFAKENEFISEKGFIPLKNQFFSDFKNIKDNELIISVFLERSEIKMFKGITNPKKIAQKINSLFLNFFKLMDELSKLLEIARQYKKIDKNLWPEQRWMLRQIGKKLNHVLTKKLSRPLTFDNILLINNKFKKYINQFTPKVKELTPFLQKAKEKRKKYEEIPHSPKFFGRQKLQPKVKKGGLKNESAPLINHTLSEKMIAIVKKK